MKRTHLLSLLIALATCTASFASVPSKLTVQGHLANGGTPMDGSHPVQFAIYGAATGGTPLWSEPDTITVVSSLFTTIIGANNPLPITIFSGQNLWLETTVDGTTLAPRIELPTSIYSFRSQHADTADVAMSYTGAGQWASDGTNVWRGTGNVGLGTTNPVSLLHLYSPLHAVASILIEDGYGAIGGSLHLKHGGSDIPASHNLGAVDYLANVGGVERIMARVLANSVNASAQQSQLTFHTANGGAPLERMRIDETGRIGIGTISPTAPLHVYSPTSGVASILVEDGGGTIGGRLQVKHSGANIPSNHILGELDFLANIGGTETLMARIVGSSVAASTQQSRMHFLTANGGIAAERLRIDENGNLGLGTSNITERLVISDSPTASSFITLRQHGTYSDRRTGIGLKTYDLPEGQNGPSHSWYMQASNNYGGLAKGFYIGEYLDLDGDDNACVGDPNELCFVHRLYIQDGTGHVGIGTVAPTTKLDVAGQVRSANGGFVFPDGSTQATAAGASLWAGSGNDAYNTNSGIVFVGPIPTGDPNTKFQISSSSPQLLLRDPNAGVNQTIGVDATGLSLNYDSGYALTVTRATGNVGIGTSTPSVKFHVVGEAMATGNTPRGTNELTVINAGLGSAIFAETNSDRTLYGAVNGKANIPGGSGIVGLVNSPGVSGVGAGSTVGVYGYNQYQGPSVGGAEIGVLGRIESYQNNSSVPVGVFGWAVGTTGNKAGVWGETESPEGYGVYSVGRMVANGDIIAASNAAQGYAGNLKTQSGDVIVNNASKGVILKSPNGNCWRIRVSDSGTLSAVAVSCP